MLGFFRSLFSYTVFIISLLGVAWLCLCYAASVYSPAAYSYLSLFSITTPFAILFNLVFAIFFLFTGKKWRSLFPLLALIVFHKLVSSVFGLHYLSGNDTEKTPGSVKVLSWNVHGMGIYNKPFDKKVPSQIIELITAEQPDIVCLPEFYADINNAMIPFSDPVLKKGGFREYRFMNDAAMYAKIYLGTAFFSKYPLSNLKEVRLSEYVKMMQCDVKLPGDRMMRTFFIHLQSFHLKDDEKTLLEDVRSRGRNLEKNQSLSFIRKLREGYRKRALQADIAAETIRQSPYPVMVCGDLNDLPCSYTYTTVKGTLADAFAARGRGVGRTYNRIFPTLRIDYILYDPALLKITGFKSPATALSDHNPVIANFEIRQ